MGFLFIASLKLSIGIKISFALIKLIIIHFGKSVCFLYLKMRYSFFYKTNVFGITLSPKMIKDS